jgi:hypothetical protein
MGLLGGFLWRRLPDLISGKTTSFDALALVILIGLALSPIFSEIKLLGFSLKQQIESVKKDVDKQLETFRAELHNSIDVRSTFTPQINFGAPPDNLLPQIERQVQVAIDSALAQVRTPIPEGVGSVVNVPSENVELFQVRFSIERELGRIVNERSEMPNDLPKNLRMPHRTVDRLVEAHFIPAELGRAIREVYAVCTAAIHGQEVSEAKVKFVRDVAPGLLTALRAI